MRRRITGGNGLECRRAKEGEKRRVVGRSTAFSWKEEWAEFSPLEQRNEQRKQESQQGSKEEAQHQSWPSVCASLLGLAGESVSRTEIVLR